MALLLLSFILMALLKVEASYEPRQLNDMIGASVPSLVPAASRFPHHLMMRVKRTPLQRDCLGSQDANLAQYQHDSPNVTPQTQHAVPKQIQRKTSQPKVPSQTQRPPKKNRGRQCYFNPISCF